MLPTELGVGVEYNINIYSEVWLNNSWYESNPLHLKLKKMINEHVVDRDTEAGEDAHGRVVEVRLVSGFRTMYYTSRKDTCIVYHREKLRYGR
jgi:hypothetical protein